MGLFDIFKKTPTVRCTQCGVQLKETDAHRYRNGVYCSICYSHQDFSAASKPEVKIDIPALEALQKKAKQQSGSDAMPASIRDVKASFDSSGIKCLSAQFGEQWEVHAGVEGKGVTYTMKFISRISDSNILGLRIFNLICVPSEKRKATLMLLSQFQTQYRFWRFNLDSSNNVTVEYDFPPATAHHGKMAVELFLRTMKVIDDIYPILSQQVWR
ncbi:MAG: hypothetical protein IKW50_04585 [Oscillospiraceae bacterium]|nr:hypothetical protein [Oscillospiraceae bacterium]